MTLSNHSFIQVTDKTGLQYQAHGRALWHPTEKHSLNIPEPARKPTDRDAICISSDDQMFAEIQGCPVIPCNSKL